MKRNNLTTAVLASIAGIAGIAGSAQAVNVNPDGLGQVLIYPFYTTNNGNQTLLSVVNTTDASKAVKVRFLESLNSREVLDFNLYMTAYDVWTAAIFDNAGTPTMITADSSCTVPYFYGIGAGLGVQPFLNFAYSGSRADADPARESISRATEGHFEIIEMGEMHDADFGSASAVTHIQPGLGPNQQEPADCQQLVDAWTINHADDYWLEDAAYDITVATGGLFGGAAIVNAQKGTMYSYDAKAINGFWSPAIPSGLRHTDPGTEVPSLISGDNPNALIFSDNGSLVSLTYGYSSIEAVSAMFMHDSIMNEYAIVDVLAAQSEWVVTFPTKRFYVDGVFATWGPTPAPIVPFTQALQTDATACEDFTIDFYDREEGTPQDAPPGTIPPGVSPRPEVPPPPGEVLFNLCAETNVIRFDEMEAEVPASPIVGTDGFDSLVTFSLPAGYDAGWAKIDMVTNRDDAGDPAPDREDTQGLLGLPVVGYWFEAFTNGTLQGGTVLANYGGVFEHKGTRAQVIIQ